MLFLNENHPLIEHHCRTNIGVENFSRKPLDNFTKTWYNDYVGSRSAYNPNRIVRTLLFAKNLKNIGRNVLLWIFT